MINHWSISIQRKSSCTHVYAGGVCTYIYTCLRRWLSGRESACQYQRDGFSPWVGKIPRRREWQPTLIFLPGKSHGQRSLGVTGCRTRLRTHTCAYTQATLFISVWSDTTCHNQRGLRTQLAHTLSNQKHSRGTFSKAKVAKDHLNEHAINAKLKIKCIHSPILTKLICR